MNRYQRDLNRIKEAERKVKRGMQVGWFLILTFWCMLLTLAYLLSQ